jgi:hypothetical protein
MHPENREPLVFFPDSAPKNSAVGRGFCGSFDQPKRERSKDTDSEGSPIKVPARLLYNKVHGFGIMRERRRTPFQLRVLIFTMGGET